MHSTGDQFFSCARLSIDQHGRVGGCNRLDLPKDLAQEFAVADDIFKVKFAANLGFQIVVFLRELIFEFRNMSVGESIFNGDSDLIGDLTEKGKIILGEGILDRKSVV